MVVLTEVLVVAAGSWLQHFPKFLRDLLDPLVTRASEVGCAMGTASPFLPRATDRKGDE